MSLSDVALPNNQRKSPYYSRHVHPLTMSPRSLKLPPDNKRELLTILLRKRFDQVIDQEKQAGLSRQDRECLKAVHQQIRADLAAIRYGATEKTVRDIEHRYR